MYLDEINHEQKRCAAGFGSLSRALLELSRAYDVDIVSRFDHMITLFACKGSNRPGFGGVVQVTGTSFAN
jgi:hypothetical protein